MDVPVRNYDHVQEGDYVVLTVADTGIGIAPKDLDRIFEPFYTKKKMGRSGTGLGMAVVWGTVRTMTGISTFKVAWERERRSAYTFPAFIPAQLAFIGITRRAYYNPEIWLVISISSVCLNVSTDGNFFHFVTFFSSRSNRSTR